jgi:ectoine hydroxylase-related dioxygenase (phytanoyl-CoA dioxygenase family)
MEGASITVDPALREKYERDGYLILDDIGVGKDVVDGAVSDLEGQYRDETYHEGGVMWAPGRVHDAWRLSENIRAIALSPKILGVLQSLYGREPKPFQTLNFQYGTQQRAHSDALHFNSMPAGYMCGVWVALEDMDMDNGPLVYYPGSQRLPEITMPDIGARADYEDYPKYEDYVQELIARDGLEPHFATIPKGQALIWSSNLLHGGSPQRDMSRTRHSQVTHYFFEGCKYYTPMQSDESSTHWRDPAWVT